ncbi:MAG: tRNA pseudouridine(55) synthase TruB [Candidatus Omnitrophota bacterium]|nr:tRNA pseudouridine(55) synthase TruB [Candidatus Omnitrophota bacterium]MDZ4242092.1 tRNA pseudouridine(55) synthase TruB [Candidatus Omnitrophota bacterium]
MEGIVVVNKPTGMTSHDVVNRTRRKFKMRQVGHAGTLDPLATGVLVMLLGKSTKLFRKFEAFDKAYRATLILGTRTTTADIQGTVTGTAPYEHISREQVEEMLKQFVGKIEQTPPMVSAVKVKGRRLYELARQGVEIERQARQITIRELKLLDFHPPRVSFFLECSKGTYVRKLAEDVGERLGCGACIAEIERTKVGPFLIEQAVSLEDLNESHVRSWQG